MWKRFDRLSKAGVFEAFFDTLAAMSSSAHLIQMFELNHRARACVGGWSKGRQEGQALGRSRGGFTTKIHAKSDASGDIIAFDLTGGEAFDGRHFETLLGIGPDIQPRVGHLRQRLRQQRQPRGGEGARHCSRDPPQGNKPSCGLLCTGPLQGPRAHRAGRRTAQALQAGRATLPEAPTRNFRSIVSFAAGLCLMEIRPHSLGQIDPNPPFGRLSEGDFGPPRSRAIAAAWAGSLC